ncbi:FAST kinase domain-containing protein 1-like [Sinocyclocheilus grahami]|uniref:FAST kinase domain-containing protein 1-like n=1 Tax=Sinocyclocheilus grahami TaxID=75366 RepID=UPI0007AD18F2|nr:PREDICTED: FAST kinase domain-containing protein 1-like [Sinocyclocheilus grahami]
MFWLRSFRACSHRLFHSGALSRDQVLEQLQTCSAEDQVFDVVGRNKAKLSTSHVSFAIGWLWMFLRERPLMFRTIKQVRNHPQFLTLRVLAENKISLMDDASVVDMLYSVHRLQVEHHDTLVQQLVTEAWNRLESYLQGSVYPYEVTMLTRVLSMLPSPRPDEAVLSRVNAVILQCNLNDLNTYATVVVKWIRNDPSYRLCTPSKYVCLLQTLNRCSRERLHSFESLDVVLEEVKCLSEEYFDEMLLEESMVTMQKLIDQISWTNVHELGVYLTRTNYFCAALMDCIASVTTENMDKIHYSATYSTLLPFAVLNYDPPKAEEFFDVCIRHFTPYISSFDPHLLVLLAYALALADYFPEEVVREIFNVDFLAKLDAHLESNSSISPAQQQIHKMLGDVLGGMNCAKVGVLMPYFYTVGEF